MSSAKILADKNNISLYSDNLNDLIKEAEIIFMALPDDKLEPVSEKLAKVSLDFQDKLFIHLSGVKSIRSLESLKKNGASTAGFHIMQTFTKDEEVLLANCYTSLESEDKNVLKILISLASALGLKYFQINPDQKIYYHLLGVFASNFMVSNFIAIEKLSGLTGLDKNFTFNFLEPLIQKTLENIKRSGASKSLSGVIARRDFESVKTHINVLQNEQEVLQTYLSLQLNLTESELGFLPDDPELLEIKDYLQKKLKEQTGSFNQS